MNMLNTNSAASADAGSGVATEVPINKKHQYRGVMFKYGDYRVQEQLVRRLCRLLLVTANSKPETASMIDLAWTMKNEGSLRRRIKAIAAINIISLFALMMVIIDDNLFSSATLTKTS